MPDTVRSLEKNQPKRRLEKNWGRESSEKNWRGLGTPGAASGVVLKKNWPGPGRLQKKTGAAWTCLEGLPVFFQYYFWPGPASFFQDYFWPPLAEAVDPRGYLLTNCSVLAARGPYVGVRSRPGMEKVALKKNWPGVAKSSLEKKPGSAKVVLSKKTGAVAENAL